MKVPKGNRVAIYGRVSTEGQNVDMQLVELREYVARRDWLLVSEYTDHISGAKESRPSLNRLINDARTVGTVHRALRSKNP